MSEIDYKYPGFRKFARKTAQLIWWTISGQLRAKVRSNKLVIVDRPHFAPLFGDHALEVPFLYAPEISSIPRLAVICHMYYEDMIDEFKHYLSVIPFAYDLYISTDTEEKKQLLLLSLKNWQKGNSEIRIVPNRGRDIAPKLICFKDIYTRYDFVLHLHSKKSPYGSRLDGWRHYLLETLLGSSVIVNSVFEIFNQNPNIGIVAPQHFEGVRISLGWGYNFKLARKLAQKLKIKLDINQYLDFPSGSMFWARTKALMPLLNAGLKAEDFPTEYNQEDGTIAHAIERMYFHVCEKAGFDWVKIGRNGLLKSTQNRVIQINNPLDLNTYFDKNTIRILSHTHSGFSRKMMYNAYLNSGYHHQLIFEEFEQEVDKLKKGKSGKIDFDEAFYLSHHPDVAHMVYHKTFPAGYIHFCLFGRGEGRIWSNNDLKTRFNIRPQIGQNNFAPIFNKPYLQQLPDLSHLPKSTDTWLLILIHHLQEDLFFAGYAEFFRDFKMVFPLFDRVTFGIQSDEYDAVIAQRHLPTVEVIHMSQLTAIHTKPHIIVAFNHQLFHKAIQMYDDYDHTVYYCQEHEAGFFPYGADYILAEQAIVKSKHIVISTKVLKHFFEQRHLLSGAANVYITSPQIVRWNINGDKSKKLFFYYRPESFQSRNLAPLIYTAVSSFCNQYRGYEIYMIGTIATSYSYTQNDNKIWITSKLPYDDYTQIICSCDLVVSLIYSAHPGVVAFQAAASGIPTITNVFENRNEAFLKSISTNLIPFDPVRQDLFKLIQLSLDLPKGNKSFNESVYGSGEDKAIDDYFKAIMSI